MRTKRYVDGLVGRRVEVVTVWREKIDGHITTRVDADGRFMLRSRVDGGFETRDLALADIASMRPALRVPVY